jgi:hypothetical protein
MSPPVAVTVVSRSHLPQVRVLADSLAEHHRAVRLDVVIVDDPGRTVGSEARFDVLSPLDLGIDESELHRRAMMFDAQGLISSLRPLAILRAIKRGAKSVLLMDADMLVLGSFAELWRQARKAGIVLSPHLLEPLGGSPGSWGEEPYLRAGTFNGGLLGVGATATRFLEWLAARSARDCVHDPARCLLYTQTWLNLVPGLFGHHVLTDAGINVTAHRLNGADLSGPPTRPEVSGAPLRLFHFTGFDPDVPEVLCRHLPGESGRLEGRPRLAALCREYAERLEAHGWRTRATYGWQGLCEPPPDPFDRHDPGRFVDWLREPPGEVSRYLLGLRETRADLSHAFPRVPGPETVGFLRWTAGQADTGNGAGGEVPLELATVRDGQRGDGRAG